jgi:hypothetical protein
MFDDEKKNKNKKWWENGKQPSFREVLHTQLHFFTSCQLRNPLKKQDLSTSDFDEVE